MPIKGLTDRPAAFPEIGRIRKGAPKEPDKPGKDLKYFRVEFDDEEKKATAIFKNTYGDEPSELNILLPFNSVDENFDAWREAYVAGGLVHRCDGERVWYEIDPESGEQLVVNRIPEEQCDRSTKCKPTGRLKVLIPELQRLAYLTVLTGSTHDVMNISRQLEALLQINGKLAGVPLKLRRRPVKISTPSGTDGKRARRVKSLLSIEADPEWVRHKLLSMKAAALPDNGLEDLPALEAPDEDDWTEGVIVEEIVEEEKKERVPFTEPVGTKEWPPKKAESLRNALIAAKVLPPDTHDIHLATFLDMSPFEIKVTNKDFIGWGKLYRGYKDETNDTKEAVRMASEAWFSGDPT